MDKNFKKNTFWNIIGTTINAFNSLFLMIIVTRINDLSYAGIFTFAFSTATLFNIIGVYAGRIYQVTDDNEFSAKEYFVNRLLTCFLMIIVSIGFILIRGYKWEKKLIIFGLCFLKMLEAFSEVLYAFFQKDGSLYKVGISLTFKSILGLISFLITDLISHDILLSIIMFITVYLLVLFLYDLKNIDIKEVLHKDYERKNVFKILVKGFGVFLTSFLTIYLINASKYSIDRYMADSIQAIFGIIIMPATVMILVAQFIIHPFLNVITSKIKDKKYDDLNKIVFKICFFIFAFGIFGSILCFFIGIPILEVIYSISLSGYSVDLSIIIIGATFYALTSVITTVLIAFRRTILLTIIYIFVSLISLFISNELVVRYSVMGASLSYFFTMLVLFIIFLASYLFIIRKERLS